MKRGTTAAWRVCGTGSTAKGTASCAPARATAADVIRAGRGAGGRGMCRATPAFRLCAAVSGRAERGSAGRRAAEAGTLPAD